MSRKKLEEQEKKIKVTISLDPDIYDSLNDYILKNKTNRSALVEKLLIKYIKNGRK